MYCKGITEGVTEGWLLLEMLKYGPLVIWFFERREEEPHWSTGLAYFKFQFKESQDMLLASDWGNGKGVYKATHRDDGGRGRQIHCSPANCEFVLPGGPENCHNIGYKGHNKLFVSMGLWLRPRFFGDFNEAKLRADEFLWISDFTGHDAFGYPVTDAAKLKYRPPALYDLEDRRVESTMLNRPEYIDMLRRSRGERPLITTQSEDDEEDRLAREASMASSSRTRTARGVSEESDADKMSD